jgi:hypothetical protein
MRIERLGRDDALDTVLGGHDNGALFRGPCHAEVCGEAGNDFHKTLEGGGPGHAGGGVGSYDWASIMGYFQTASRGIYV